MKEDVGGGGRRASMWGCRRICTKMTRTRSMSRGAMVTWRRSGSARRRGVWRRRTGMDGGMMRMIFWQGRWRWSGASSGACDECLFFLSLFLAGVYSDPDGYSALIICFIVQRLLAYTYLHCTVYRSVRGLSRTKLGSQRAELPCACVYGFGGEEMAMHQFISHNPAM